MKGCWQMRFRSLQSGAAAHPACLPSCKRTKHTKTAEREKHGEHEGVLADALQVVAIWRSCAPRVPAVLHSECKYDTNTCKGNTKSYVPI
jgi:hypothetical protein